MSDELEPELREALRDEAYRPPVLLTAVDLSPRLEAERRRGMPRWWPVAAAATVSIVLVAAMVSFTPSLRPGGETATPEAPAVCEESPAVEHGSWWVEIGGPNAFFNIKPGSLWANDDESAWLLHTRFDPDAGPGEDVSIRAEHLGSGQRVDGRLNGRADLGNIYQQDEPAPQLPGGLYLFEQALPVAGCWRLVASIGDRIVGQASIEIPPRWGPLETSRPSEVVPTPRIGTGAITERSAAPTASDRALLEDLERLLSEAARG